MGVENCVENLNKQGYSTLGKMPQGPLQDTIWDQSLADFKTPDGFLNLVRVGKLGFTGRGQEVRLQCHINQLNAECSLEDGFLYCAPVVLPTLPLVSQQSYRHGAANGYR
jgi:hypothetical protein